jgi:hypothetical protein
VNVQNTCSFRIAYLFTVFSFCGGGSLGTVQCSGFVCYWGWGEGEGEKGIFITVGGLL